MLIAPRAEKIISPLVSLGRLALTFYVFQVVLTKFVANPTETSFPTEVATVGAVYVGFMIFAHIWTRWFRFGPLESLLRVEEIGRILSKRRAARLGRS